MKQRHYDQAKLANIQTFNKRLKRVAENNSCNTFVLNVIETIFIHLESLFNEPSTFKMRQSFEYESTRIQLKIWFKKMVWKSISIGSTQNPKFSLSMNCPVQRIEITILVNFLEAWLRYHTFSFRIHIIT